MTHQSTELTSLVEARIVELESDYAYEEKTIREKKEEARRHRSLAANLDTECELHVDNMHDIAHRIKDLKEALE